MLTILMTSLLWQDPPKGRPPKPAPPASSPAAPAPGAPAPAAPAGSTPAKVPEAWDDKAAKAAIAEWSKLGKDASMAERARALERLANGANKLLVKPLAQVVETDKSLVIRKRAAELLAGQPAADANTALVRLLKSDKVRAAPAIQAEIVRGIGKSGYTPSSWREFEAMFDREYHLDLIPMQEAVLELVIQHKEKQAIEMLLRNLDEPYPTDIDGAANPPKEYWEARWKCWSAWRSKVKDALFAVTGQRFSTAAEAQEWLKKNPLK